MQKRDVSDAEMAVWKAGTRAWTDLKRHKTWGLWATVGDALLSGRHHAMVSAGTNEASGAMYSRAFAYWLEENRLDDIDKGDRAALLRIMDNRSEIERWRDALTQTERLTLNHPRTVWKKFTKDTKPPSEPKTLKASRENETDQDEDAANELNDALALLQAARRHIRLLERHLRRHEPPPARPELLTDDMSDDEVAE